MSVLQIELEGGRTAWRPGEKLRGTASWLLDESVESLEVRLLWFTRGKGTQDVSVVDQRTFRLPALDGRDVFSFDLPPGPYSFSGRLISLTWALELVTPKGRESQRVEFVLSPSESEIILGSAEEAGK